MSCLHEFSVFVYKHKSDQHEARGRSGSTGSRGRVGSPSRTAGTSRRTRAPSERARMAARYSSASQSSASSATATSARRSSTAPQLAPCIVTWGKFPNSINFVVFCNLRCGSATGPKRSLHKFSERRSIFPRLEPTFADHRHNLAEFGRIRSMLSPVGVGPNLDRHRPNSGKLWPAPANFDLNEPTQLWADSGQIW